jgi:hypothetical protein
MRGVNYFRPVPRSCARAAADLSGCLRPSSTAKLKAAGRTRLHSVSLSHGWHPVPPFPVCAVVCFVNFHTRQRRQPLALPVLTGYACDRKTR